MIISTTEHHKQTSREGCKIESHVTPTHEHVTMECPLQLVDDKPGKVWITHSNDNGDNWVRKLFMASNADRSWWHR